MSLNEALSWIAMPLSHSIDRPRPCSAAGNPTKNVDIVSIESRASPGADRVLCTFVRTRIHARTHTHCHVSQDGMTFVPMTRLGGSGVLVVCRESEHRSAQLCEEHERNDTRSMGDGNDQAL